MKKKKSKKKPFDLDAALADGSETSGSAAAAFVDVPEKSDESKDSGVDALTGDALDFDDNLDLESFGKKKKKKKKPFNLEDIENSLPEPEVDADAEAAAGEVGAGDDGEAAGEEYDLDVDFSKTKKKKKKKKDLDELVAEKLEADVQENKENGEW